MRILFDPNGWQDYLWWQANDPKGLVRVNELIRDITRQPFSGIGKPEALRANLTGWWSRRISGEHRIVYRVVGKEDERRVEIIQCRYHY
ncbi:MAG: Txe/YoeB family addiction module toxin [Sphingomonadales bacterium]